MAKPIKKYRVGQIECAVFENAGAGFEGAEDKTFQSFSFQKSYKDKAGAWKNTSYFSEQDLRSLTALVNAVMVKQVKEVTITDADVTNDVSPI